MARRPSVGATHSRGILPFSGASLAAESEPINRGASWREVPCLFRCRLVLSHRALLHTLGEREIGDPDGSCALPGVEDDLARVRDVLRLEPVLVSPPVFGQRH